MLVGRDPPVSRTVKVQSLFTEMVNIENSASMCQTKKFHYKMPREDSQIGQYLQKKKKLAKCVDSKIRTVNKTEKYALASQIWIF